MVVRRAAREPADAGAPDRRRRRRPDAARRRLRHRRAARAPRRAMLPERRDRARRRPGRLRARRRQERAPGLRRFGQCAALRRRRVRRDLQRRCAVPCAVSTSARRWRSFTAASATDGMLVLNLPAYRWMLSRHDSRFPMSGAIPGAASRGCCEGAGFRLLLRELLERAAVSADGPDPQAAAVATAPPATSSSHPPPVEALCRAATGARTCLLRRGLRLPFGGSLIAVAAKRAPRAEYMPDSMTLMPGDPVPPRAAQPRRSGAVDRDPGL